MALFTSPEFLFCVGCAAAAVGLFAALCCGVAPGADAYADEADRPWTSN